VRFIRLSSLSLGGKGALLTALANSAVRSHQAVETTGFPLSLRAEGGTHRQGVEGIRHHEATQVDSDDESTMVAQLRIANLLANAPIDPEAHLDAALVEHYAQMIDTLPPVVVFDTEEVLLLADGYHRVAAARRRGLETIETEVRPGSRQDALRYAATVGAAQRGISPEEAASYIIRQRSQRRWSSEH
jgi:hypothetical protein